MRRHGLLVSGRKSLLLSRAYVVNAARHVQWQETVLFNPKRDAREFLVACVIADVMPLNGYYWRRAGFSVSRAFLASAHKPRHQVSISHLGNRASSRNITYKSIYAGYASMPRRSTLDLITLSFHSRFYTTLHKLNQQSQQRQTTYQANNIFVTRLS